MLFTLLLVCLLGVIPLQIHGFVGPFSDGTAVRSNGTHSHSFRRSDILSQPFTLSPRPYRRHSPFLLTTTTSDDDKPLPQKTAVQRAVAKFKDRPTTYLMIPVVAALVGWITNWMAVQMIFYPIKFRGIPIVVKPEVPLGLVGWQGILPCKTSSMSASVVDMVTSQLLTVPQVFDRLDPVQISRLLTPQVPILGKQVLQETLGVPGLGTTYKLFTSGVSQVWSFKFLQGLTKSMQASAESVFDLKSCVVNQMMMDRGKLGELFKVCGQAELDFLTNSGLWFGFLLGWIQLVVALFWDNPWSLSIGGGIVGLATNWLALKWIFEPVNPVRIGPIVLQGKFLRRQPEVAREFSKFFANKILAPDQIWNSILNEPATKEKFSVMFGHHFQTFIKRLTVGCGALLSPGKLQELTNCALEKLPEHLPCIFPYMKDSMRLEESLRVSMENMSSRQFERVLHPIFEQDELTLILAGAALGFAAGLIQQGLETGAIQLPNLHLHKYASKAWSQTKKLWRRIRGESKEAEGLE